MEASRSLMPTATAGSISISAMAAPSPALDLIDRHGRPAVGARVAVTAGGGRQCGFIVSGGSYLAASEPRLWFGLGSAQTAERIEVAWPWGKTESWSNQRVPVKSALRLRERPHSREPGE